MKDLVNLGWNQATVSLIGCVVCTLLGGYGQLDQIKKIKRSMSTANISTLMNIIMFTLFTAYIVRGVAEHKFMFLVQGVIRTTLSILIILCIMRFGDFTLSNRIGLLVSVIGLLYMSTFGTMRESGFLVISLVGLIGAGHQAWSIRRRNGQLSFKLYLTMFASVSFQSWYGWYYHDMSLLIACSLFALLYGIILILMIRNSLQSQNTVAS
jgi:hypothetical protein